MKPVTLLFIFFGFTTIQAQTYKSVYNYYIAVELDSTSTVAVQPGFPSHLNSDSMLKLAVKSLIKMQWQVESSPASARSTLKISSNSGFSIEVDEESQTVLLFENGQWSIAKDKTAVYTINFKLTGNHKKILGYDCEEAISTDAENKTTKAWFCKSLPKTVNPGINIKGVEGALMEYLSPEDDKYYTLQEIRKTDAATSK